MSKSTSAATSRSLNLIAHREKKSTARRLLRRPSPLYLIYPLLYLGRMIFADLELSRRLERAEAQSGLEFAEARAHLHPTTGAQANAAWMEHAGTIAIYDGPDSPITQTFCLGLFKDLNAADLDVIESFFFYRASPVTHEVSPHAGVSTIDLLCARGYRPVELSSVMHQDVCYRDIMSFLPDGAESISVRLASPEDSHLWADLSAEGWSSDYPEMAETIRNFGRVAFSRPNTVNFIASVEGQPAATGSLCMYRGVALFAGASTVPEFRCRGLQYALLSTRMNHAATEGFELAMMVTAVGSQSQRNAERSGFKIAYTRTKWQRAYPD